MAAKIIAAGYFAAIQDLSLTPDQERELESYLPMVRRICRRFYRRNNSAYSLLDDDDLIQMALVRVAGVIKATSEPKCLAYYIQVVTRACLASIKNSTVYGSINNHMPIDSSFDIEAHDDIERVHNRMYVDTLLESVNSDISKKILLHYYGIDTPQLRSKAIGDMLGMKEGATIIRRNRSINTIRAKIAEGELPTWETE